MSDVTVIASGLQFPEGPVVLPDGSFLVVEIRRQTLTRVRLDGTTEVVATTGGRPSAPPSARTAASIRPNNGGFV